MGHIHGCLVAACLAAAVPMSAQQIADKYSNLNQLVILVMGKAAEVEDGDSKEHPGSLKDAAKLPNESPRPSRPLDAETLEIKKGGVEKNKHKSVVWRFLERTKLGF